MARKKNLPAGMSPQAFSKGGKVLKQKSAKVPRVKQTAGSALPMGEPDADDAPGMCAGGGMKKGGKVKKGRK